MAITKKRVAPVRRRDQTEQVSLRLPVATLQRAEALRAKVHAESAVSTVAPITRATVLKLAVIRGLEALEREHR